MLQSTKFSSFKAVDNKPAGTHFVTCSVEGHKNAKVVTLQPIAPGALSGVLHQLAASCTSRQPLPVLVGRTELSEVARTIPAEPTTFQAASQLNSI